MMSRSQFRMTVLLFSGLLISPLHAQMPSMPQIPGLGGGAAAGLSDTKIASGLKDALSVGTKKAVTLVDHPGGYLDNQAIKILLPSNLRPVESALRGAGQGPKIDGFIASMNHAAESAAPEAEKIFADAVTSMTIDDARKLLNGKDTAITDYFREKTSASLTAAFRPHVEAAMQVNGVTQQYDALRGQIPAMPFMKSPTLDINSYVVGKALDGLFYMLGQQEKEIRTNPAARSTALLKQVFGK
jgi:hypothetical protein